MSLMHYYSEPTLVLDPGYDDAVVAPPRLPRAALVKPILLDEPWRVPIDQRLAKLSGYQRGWDGYNSAPPSRTVIEYARSILNSVMLPGTPAPSIVPMSGGGLQLEWHTGGIDIELAIFRPREAELSVEFSDGREPLEDEQLTSKFDALSAVLEEIS